MIRWSIVSLIFISSIACAKTEAEDSCFISGNKHDVPIRLALRTYVDKDIHQVVGAIVRYGTSKNFIPLVFAGSTITKDGFEDHWLEVFNKTITGEYIYEKSGVGGGIGAYSFTYRSFGAGKMVHFSVSTDTGGECLALRADTKQD